MIPSMTCYDYCYHVASVIGLMCIEVFGYQTEQAKRYAEKLGVAFQLTNILRDVKNDAGRAGSICPAKIWSVSGMPIRTFWDLYTTNGSSH